MTNCTGVWFRCDVDFFNCGSSEVKFDNSGPLHEADVVIIVVI